MNVHLSSFWSVAPPASALLILSLLAMPALGGDRIADEFLTVYARHEPALYKKYVENRKVRFTARDFMHIDLKTREITIRETATWGEKEVISDGKQFRVCWVGDPTATWAKTRMYWSPSLSYYVKPGKNGKMEVTMNMIASAKPASYEQSTLQGLHLMPLRLGAGYEFRTSVALAPQAAPQRGSFPAFVGKSFRQTTWNNKKAAELVLHIQHPVGGGQTTPVECKYYFDPENDYAALGMETALRPGTLYKVPHREVNVLEYQMAGEPYPLPKTFRQFYVLGNGTRKLSKEVEFLSNERYTPDPEEFRLEKEYGLTTPDASRLGAGAGRRAWPWWLLGIGLLLGAGVAFWGVVRRRSQARTGPRPLTSAPPAPTAPEPPPRPPAVPPAHGRR